LLPVSTVGCFLQASEDVLVDVQGLHGHHERVGDASGLQPPEGLPFVEVVRPRAATVATQEVLADVDPHAALPVLAALAVVVVEANLIGGFVSASNDHPRSTK